MELVTPEGRSQRSLQKASFLPVHVMQAGATASPSTRIEIQLTNGVRVFVPISDSETVENTIAVASRLSALNDTAMNQDRATCGGRDMLTCPTHLPIYFCAQPVDFRKSFDGLTGVIASVFEISVLDGHLFLFINKRRDRIKAMWWDRDGLVLFYKRLEKGTFEMPRVSDQSTHITLDATQLSMLLGGVALAAAKQRRKRFLISQ